MFVTAWRHCGLVHHREGPGIHHLIGLPEQLFQGWLQAFLFGCESRLDAFQGGQIDEQGIVRLSNAGLGADAGSRARSAGFHERQQAQIGLKKIVIGIDERDIDLRFARLAADAVLEQKMAVCARIGPVGR
ncbi:MAG: hypothetical protein BWY77_00901 [bacterium ADurb.Bin431]|nr:MAG: hypothetical protein BWY77_00901 [bacterium ADurb.Bin431]